jgi:hypothetical protein
MQLKECHEMARAKAINTATQALPLNSGTHPDQVMLPAQFHCKKRKKGELQQENTWMCYRYSKAHKQEEKSLCIGNRSSVYRPMILSLNSMYILFPGYLMSLSRPRLLGLDDRMADELLNNLEGSGRDLVEEFSHNLPGGTE